MTSFPVFPGNCPGNVKRDAKYVVRSGHSGPVVALTYDAGDDERWHVTTEAHPALVKMVNGVKRAMGGSTNGPFYINEYHQVIIPVGDSATYYYAGEYDQPLEFAFEGKLLSGKASDSFGAGESAVIERRSPISTFPLSRRNSKEPSFEFVGCHSATVIRHYDFSLFGVVELVSGNGY